VIRGRQARVSSLAEHVEEAEQTKDLMAGSPAGSTEEETGE
jgi:hypothetical protein